VGSVPGVRRLCLLAALSTLVGCGSAQSTQSTEFVARASKLCREVSDRRPRGTDAVAIDELRLLLRANDHLPLVRSWLADVAARKRLRRAEAEAPAGPPRAKVFRRQVTIYDAERRLPGIGGCTQSPYIGA
jgi:hypothetical protein